MTETMGAMAVKKVKGRLSSHVALAEEERQGLVEGLSRTRVLIAQAYEGFNRATDSDLIESYVFEINALQSRYTYLLKRVKELS